MESKHMRIRRNWLMGFCSIAVVNAVLYDPMTDAQKFKILERAKQIAKAEGRYRVYVEDWQQALDEMNK